jgi:hypothetical protein
VETPFGPFRDSANLDEVHGLHRTYQGSEIILELLGDVGHVKSYFDPFGDSVSVSAI